MGPFARVVWGMMVSGQLELVMKWLIYHGGPQECVEISFLVLAVTAIVPFLEMKTRALVHLIKFKS